MVDLKSLFDTESSGQDTREVSAKPDLRDLDRKISVVIDGLIPVLLPFYDRCFCASAFTELGTSCLIQRFEALEQARGVKAASLNDLTSRILREEVRQRAETLKGQIEDLCAKRDRASSKVVGDDFQRKIMDKAKELAPLRVPLRQHKELDQELRIFSSRALRDLCRTLHTYLAGVDDWETLSQTIRPQLKEQVFLLKRLEEERIASVSDLLADETEA